MMSELTYEQLVEAAAEISKATAKAEGIIFRLHPNVRTKITELLQGTNYCKALGITDEDIEQLSDEALMVLSERFVEYYER